MNANRDALTPVREYRAKPDRLVTGLMTGTSADAVDTVLVRLKGEGLAATHEVLAERESPLDDDLRAEVLAVAAAKTLEPERLMRPRCSSAPRRRSPSARASPS